MELYDYHPITGFEGHEVVFGTAGKTKSGEPVAVAVVPFDPWLTCSSRLEDDKKRYFMRKAELVAELADSLLGINDAFQAAIIIPYAERSCITAERIKEFASLVEKTGLHIVDILPVEHKAHELVEAFAQLKLKVRVYYRGLYVGSYAPATFTQFFEVISKRRITVLESYWRKYPAVHSRLAYIPVKYMLEFARVYMKGRRKQKASRAIDVIAGTVHYGLELPVPKEHGKSKSFNEEVLSRLLVVPNWLHELLLRNAAAPRETIVAPKEMCNYCRIEDEDFRECYNRVRTLLVPYELFSDLSEKYSEDTNDPVSLLERIAEVAVSELKEEIPWNYCAGLSPAEVKPVVLPELELRYF